MPVQCPQGVPQAACDTLGGLLQAQGVNPQGWDASNVATTLQQWYATMSKQNPNVPPALPPNAADYALPPFASVLPSVLSYWTNVGYRNPGIMGNVNPAAWTFPWQYVSPQATDWKQATVTALGSMLGDPNALPGLLKGQLPPFDPTKINWQQFGIAPIASDPNTFANTANGVGQLTPVMQDFLTRAAACNLLQKSATEVQQAWSDFVSFGKDPCATAQPQQQLPPVIIQPIPVPPPTAPPTTTTTPATSNGALIVVGVVGLGAVGVLLYMLAKSRPTAAAVPRPAEASEEEDAHQHSFWRGWNIVVEPRGRGAWHAYAMRPQTNKTFKATARSSYDAVEAVKHKIAHHYRS
jgi:hypothetical protein